MMLPRSFSTLSALLVLTWLSVHSTVAQDVKKPARPFPGGEKADIWILAGQSNMGGWGLLKAPIETDPRVMEFKNPKWVLAENPVHKNFVSPSWDPKGKDAVLENMYRTSEGRYLVSGGDGCHAPRNR